MMPNKIKLITEGTRESILLQALFVGERRRRLVEVSSLFLPNEAVRAAELSLLQHPERPVALILNAGLKESEVIEKRQRSLVRILSKITPHNWHVTLAKPDVSNWVLADPGLDAEYQASPDKGLFIVRLPNRILQITEQRELDGSKIEEKHPEFRELVEFIRRHAPVPTSSI